MTGTTRALEERRKQLALEIAGLHRDVPDRSPSRLTLNESMRSPQAWSPSRLALNESGLDESRRSPARPARAWSLVSPRAARRGAASLAERDSSVNHSFLDLNASSLPAGGHLNTSALSASGANGVADVWGASCHDGVGSRPPRARRLSHVELIAKARAVEAATAHAIVRAKMPLSRPSASTLSFIGLDSSFAAGEGPGLEGHALGRTLLDVSIGRPALSLDASMALGPTYEPAAWRGAPEQFQREPHREGLLWRTSPGTGTATRPDLHWGTCGSAARLRDASGSPLRGAYPPSPPVPGEELFHAEAGRDTAEADPRAWARRGAAARSALGPVPRAWV